jgi:hypothetical protein
MAEFVVKPAGLVDQLCERADVLEIDKISEEDSPGRDNGDLPRAEADRAIGLPLARPS